MNPVIRKYQFIIIVFVFIFIVAVTLILSIYFSPSKISKSIPSGNTDVFFVNLPKELLKRDATIPLTPNAGYLITTSLLSNKKDKIVYSEISDCIKKANSYNTNNQTCDWAYNIFVKDLQTGALKKIYSYPENIYLTGACSLVHFPIAWSKNDQKIIFQWGNPTSCGSGGAPRYLTYSINPDGGSLENLSTYQPIFLNEYEKVVYIEESSQSPPVCGPVTQVNNGKIVLTKIESGETTTLLEEPNSEYSLLSADDAKGIVKYSVKKVLNVNGCSEIDSSIEEKIEQIQIP